MTQLLIAVLLSVALGALWARRRWTGLTTKRKKRILKKKIGNVYRWGEEKGLIPRTPAFDHNYLRDYPKLALLEENYETVRKECLSLLEVKDELTDMQAMGGAYTQAGIHTAKWKTFMFKSGSWVEPNCRRCPETTALLEQIPDVYTAFFSVLDPHQYITPHWGYYKGFVRYHLGVIIPSNNADQKCWLRVNGDPEANAKRDLLKVEEGEVYHWKNGKGVIFDDNYLHDAANDSDETRVVLWVDLARKLPFYYDWFNRLCLFVIHREKTVQEIRQNAVV